MARVSLGGWGAWTGRLAGLVAIILDADVVLEPAADDVEGVADRHEGVLVLLSIMSFPADDELAAPDGQVDTHVEQVPLAPVPVKLLEHDPRGGDAVMKAIELLGALLDSGGDGVRRLHAAEGDLHRKDHVPSRCKDRARLAPPAPARPDDESTEERPARAA